MSSTYSRTPASFTSEIATSTEMNKMPRGILGGAIMDASQAGIGGEVSVSDLQFTFETEANRRIKLGGLLNIQSTAANVGGTLKIKEGATVLQTVAVEVPNTANKDAHVSFEFPIAGFTAGTHTITITLAVDGLATLQVTCSSSQKANAWAEDVGPAS